VDLVDAGCDLLAYIDRFRDYDTVVLVDAVVDESGGGVVTVPEETFSTWKDRSLSAHELSAVGCVKLFRALHREGDGSDPVITLVALMIPERHFHRGPTPPEIDAATAAVYLASCGSAGV
jgi:Ni,Fe-hydrogenase maturation factor